MTFAFIIWLVTVFIPSLSALTEIFLVAFIGMFSFLAIHGVAGDKWGGFKKLISYKNQFFFCFSWLALFQARKKLGIF